MHKLWLDTNILIDYLLRRKPFEAFAFQWFEKVEAKEIIAYTSIINLIHAHYQLRKITGEWIAREMVGELVKVIQVHEIPSSNYINALGNLEVRGFEDAVQFELAIFSGSNFFITRDPSGFPKNAPFTICDAATYLNNYSLKG